MKRLAPLFPILLVLLALPACAPAPETKAPAIDPPVAKVVPHELETHGHVRTDNYYWLNDREDPEVIAYLEAENEYAEAAMQPTAELREELFEEITGRIQQDDASVPYRLRGYYYYTRYEEGGEYAIYCRKSGSLDGAEEILLDGNAMAEGESFFSIRGRQVSADNNLLAYAVDTVGRRIYTIQFKDLRSGELLEDRIPEVTGNMTWANDNRTLFYTKQDPTTLRSFQIWAHVLGQESAQDRLVYEESDETFSAFVYKTKSDRYIVIGSRQTESSEYRVLDADRPDGEFQVVQPRERELEYSLDHFQGHFYIRTNWEARNFRLMRTPVERTTKANWEEVIAHRDDVLFENFELFTDYLVVGERSEGLRQIRVMPWNGEGEHYLDFGEPAYRASVSINPEFDTGVLRYSYTSMTTPNSTFDYDMKTREKTLLKEAPVLGGFDKANYRTERLQATADDGTQVPISIVYREGIKADGSAPLLLYGYGSYGASMDASFDSARLSLLDRGFVYALAHIRGGQELGRQWYEDGKLLNKMNTFTDFIDSGEFLVESGWADPDRLFIYGGSAGGLLVGAVVNMKPELFRGAIAAVPFVDVVTTMLDDSIPLTTGEYDEWGNPNEREYYDYMLSYSPYDNVEAKDYPELLVTTGLHDSQVQYWEPAKWVAKLRAMKTDDHRLLLKTDMESGHGGASGRFKRYRRTAYNYSFLLDLAGIAE